MYPNSKHYWAKVCTLLLLLLSHFSRVRLCVTPWTEAHQASPSLGFSRQEHWSGLPFPSPMYESEKVKVKSLSRVRLLATPWTAAYQAPLPMGFSRQEYWTRQIIQQSREKKGWGAGGNVFEGRKWWMRENSSHDEPETHLEVATTMQIPTWDHLREERQSGLATSFSLSRQPENQSLRTDLCMYQSLH